MYSHIIKGFTVGHLLTRRILRRLTSLPGVGIDAVVAMFWTPHYQDYWKDENWYLEYFDNTRVGVFEGIFGWIGEAIGALVGSFVGSLIGLFVYGIDSALSLVRFIQLNLYNDADKLENFIVSNDKDLPFLIEVSIYRAYIVRAWNLGSFVLGGLVAIGPLILTKTLEFLIPPLGKGLSRGVMEIAGFFGGLGLSIVSIPLYPVVYLFKRSMELYQNLREKVRFCVAIVYGMTKTTLSADDKNDVDCTFPKGTLHSEEFRREKAFVEQQSSWAGLMEKLIKHGFHAPLVAIPVNPPASAPILSAAPSEFTKNEVKNASSSSGTGKQEPSRANESPPSYSSITN